MRSAGDGLVAALELEPPFSLASTDLALLADVSQVPALPPAALVLAWGLFVAKVARAKACVGRTR